jgi:hypothetical protein
MPERVTREERKISLAIEKARDAKEELLLSLENNRSPLEKDNIMEKIKLKKPKAAKVTQYKTNTDGKEGYGLGGEVTEFKKALDVLKESIRGYGRSERGGGESNPVLDKEKEEEIEELISQVNKDMTRLKDDLVAGKINQKDFQEKMQELTREINLPEVMSKPTQRFR